MEEICFQGPKERLNTTLCTQPILFIVIAAVFRIFRSDPLHQVGARDGTEGALKKDRFGDPLPNGRDPDEVRTLA